MGLPPLSCSQRWRWLNGSFFAAVHSTVHFHHIYRSSHAFLRKFWIHIETFYQLYNLIFSWFALVRQLHIAFIVLTHALEDYISSLHYLNLVLNYFYLGLLISRFILSLGNRRQVGVYPGFHWVCSNHDIHDDFGIPSCLQGCRERCQVGGPCYPSCRFL
ncbi:hypothetical protein L210DRAFT_3479389 [Boletus edulis BED1]|uniref:chitin synthase n=1 Tax=Boletus edulis BED1 TaxID=1328754 RepID=A0AAD4GFI8_BOLED|nr:hypothetical protein L210DRAFT_3479389 [Boletus edulis BED1]